MLESFLQFTAESSINQEKKVFKWEKEILILDVLQCSVHC